jgi:hypothetical protein
MQRLLQLAPQQGPASIVADHPQQQRRQPQKNDNTLVRDPMKQLNTVEQAAALESQLENTALVPCSVESSLDRRPRLGWGHGQQQQQQQGLQGSSSSSDSRRGPIHPVLAQQQLFSVYVHSPDGMLLPPASIFSGAELRVRLNTTQGYAQHVLAEAAVLLLRAALQDESNVHFVMVSDTSIPLYPPQVRPDAGPECRKQTHLSMQRRNNRQHLCRKANCQYDVLAHHATMCMHHTALCCLLLLLLQVVWAQMMSEQRSRLDACTYRRKDIDVYRWAVAAFHCSVPP